MQRNNNDNNNTYTDEKTSDSRSGLGDGHRPQTVADPSSFVQGTYLRHRGGTERGTEVRGYGVHGGHPEGFAEHPGRPGAFDESRPASQELYKVYHHRALPMALRLETPRTVVVNML